MSHYASIDSNNIVTYVIVADSGYIATQPGEWIQTSYNTRANVHYAPNSNTPDSGLALRGNYAGIGYTYDRANDVFYAPQPYPSWTLSTSTWTWNPPTPMPTDGKFYVWDEPTTSWITP